MNRKSGTNIITLLSLTFIFFLITNNSLVLESVSFSISIWKDSLFPTLFPFFVISSILIELKFTETLGTILAKPMKKIFNLSNESSFVLISSLFSGFPSGAKLTTDLVKKKRITKEEASRLLMFTHYSNPLFILGFIASLLTNKKLVYIILISHTLSGILIGIIFTNVEINNNQKESKREETLLPLGQIFSSSIMNSLNTMFLLLGIVTIFTLITSFIQTTFNLPIFYKSILSSIFEMTQGIKNISCLNIDELLKALLITITISFGGLSVHMQVLSIISEENIKYKPFFFARILHAIIASLLVFILYYLL